MASKKKVVTPKKSTTFGKGYGENVRGNRIQSRGSVAYRGAVSYGGKPEEIWEVVPFNSSDALVGPRAKKSSKRKKGM